VSDPVLIGPPLKPDREAVPLCLLVEVREDDVEAAELALRQVVELTLGKDARGTDWRVSRLFPAVEDDREGLDRFFEVTGHVGAYGLERQAWDLAYALRDALAKGGHFEVQPDLPSSVFHPDEEEDPDTTEAWPFGKSKPLPESEPHDWSLKRMQCPEAWALSPVPGGAVQGEGIRIGHPDTGYVIHPELGADALDLTRDADVLAGDDDARDPLQGGWGRQPGHGTRTGSVIVSRAGGGISGAAPLATLVPIRTIKRVIQVFDRDVAKAVEHARQVGCHVISMSLGGSDFFGLEAAIERAVRDGLIVMAAAGNVVEFVVWPAFYPNCLAVAAVNAKDLPWRHSAHGKAVDVSAPGESVWAADLALRDPSGVVRSSGTSFAVANLAGVAALWLAFHGRDALIARYGKELIQAVFLQVLTTEGCRQPDRWDADEWGAGIVDAKALLEAPLPDPTSVAQAFEEAAVRRRRTPLEKIESVLPSLERDEVLRRLAALFGVGGEGLDAALVRYADELRYRLTEDAAFRDAFVRADVTKETAGPPPVGTAELRVALAQDASSRLLEAIVES